MNDRKLNNQEIAQLQSRGCTAEDWSQVYVAPGFNPTSLQDVHFSGQVHLGTFEHAVHVLGGAPKPAGIRHAHLHNATVGNDCCIENIRGLIAGYHILHDSYIADVGSLVVDGPTTFGNGTTCEVVDEGGSRPVVITDQLSAPLAWLMVCGAHLPAPTACAISESPYMAGTDAESLHATGAAEDCRSAARHTAPPSLSDRLTHLTHQYVKSKTATMGTIGPHAEVVDAGTICNVCIGPHCSVMGAKSLINGSLVGSEQAPASIGPGVVAQDFIVCAGSNVDDHAQLRRCFVGQSCTIGGAFAAGDSLFFANTHLERGEACALFAGPFTVSHHRSTLLIAGMHSFLNAGSGSNQSNHAYKLGPIHYGLTERGTKLASDSYLLWPAAVGPFSVVSGRITSHPDTRLLPFSHLSAEGDAITLTPAATLRSIGTLRDERKWPRRDHRIDTPASLPAPDNRTSASGGPLRPTSDQLLDPIHYPLLSPYTVGRMIEGHTLLQHLRQTNPTAKVYTYKGTAIPARAIDRGLHLYDMAITAYMGRMVAKLIDADGITGGGDYITGGGEGRNVGGSLGNNISPSTDGSFSSSLNSCNSGNLCTSASHGLWQHILQRLTPQDNCGSGTWLDMAGLLIPQDQLQALIDDIISDQLPDLQAINARLHSLWLDYDDLAANWVRHRLPALLEQPEVEQPEVGQSAVGQSAVGQSQDAQLTSTLPQLTPHDLIALLTRWRAAEAEWLTWLQKDASRDQALAGIGAQLLDIRPETSPEAKDHQPPIGQDFIQTYTADIQNYLRQADDCIRALG